PGGTRCQGHTECGMGDCATARRMACGKGSRMLQRLGIGLLASVVGLSAGFLIGRGIAGPRHGKSIGLTGRAYAQSPTDKTGKLLAEPTLHAWPGRKASFLSGGEISSKFDDSLHEIGTKFQAIITPHSADTYELKMEFTLGTDLTNE